MRWAEWFPGTDVIEMYQACQACKHSPIASENSVHLPQLLSASPPNWRFGLVVCRFGEGGSQLPSTGVKPPNHQWGCQTHTAAQRLGGQPRSPASGPISTISSMACVPKESLSRMNWRVNMFWNHSTVTIPCFALANPISQTVKRPSNIRKFALLRWFGIIVMSKMRLEFGNSLLTCYLAVDHFCFSWKNISWGA